MVKARMKLFEGYLKSLKDVDIGSIAKETHVANYD
jgi:hypothetical protein